MNFLLNSIDVKLERMRWCGVCVGRETGGQGEGRVQSLKDQNKENKTNLVGE